MSDPDVLKQILKDAKKEIEEWPQWMRSQEPALRARDNPPVHTADEPKVEDERLTA